MSSVCYPYSSKHILQERCAHRPLFYWPCAPGVNGRCELIDTNLCNCVNDCDIVHFWGASQLHPPIPSGSTLCSMIPDKYPISSSWMISSRGMLHVALPVWQVHVSSPLSEKVLYFKIWIKLIVNGMLGLIVALLSIGTLIGALLGAL